MILSSAYSKDYFRLRYKIEKGDNLTKILKSFVKDNSVINIQTPFVQKIFKNNPQIKEWKNLTAESVIELYISDDFIDLNKYNLYEKNMLKKLADAKYSSPAMKKFSLFYLSSMGNFTQTSERYGEINFKQNSPLSLGASYTFFPKDKIYSYSFSGYYSILRAGVASLTSESVSIPPEIGGNAYFEYRWKPNGLSVYTGPDYETFSAFSLQGLNDYQKIYIDRIGMLYWTVGIANGFTMFKKQFFLKISASKSLISSYKNNAPASPITGLVEDGKYSGNRYTLYLNYKLNDKFYLHTLLKYHSLTGPSRLTSLRVGAGFGYSFF